MRTERKRAARRMAGALFVLLLTAQASPAGAANEAAADDSPPSPAQVLSEKGERAYRQENYRLAERRFRAALALEPGHPYALTGLGWTLYDAGRPEEAFAFFKKAYALFPEDGSARRGFAYLLYRYGRFHEARELLGSLDQKKWPEIANIDFELARRAAQGLPPPRMPEEPEAKAGKPAAEASVQEIPRAPPASVRQVRTARLAPAPPAGKPTLEDMIEIPGGRFMMGASFDEPKKTRRRRRRRRPAPVVARGGHPAEVAPFLLDKFEVTNSLYAAFARATRRPDPPYWRKVHFTGPHMPVVGVTWEEARDYCAWAGKRLPTEAEWEYAAQGADAARRYPWGSARRGIHAVFGLNPDTGGPKAVGRRPGGASLHGAEDLAGNVWEWVETAYRKNPEDAHPIGPPARPYRTLKGGSWVNGWWALVSSSRTGDRPDRRLPVYGFRCAADARKR